MSRSPHTSYSRTRYGGRLVRLSTSAAAVGGLEPHWGSNAASGDSFTNSPRYRHPRSAPAHKPESEALGG